LEGKLKPREEVIHLGRAVVRQLFKVSRSGTIAGCFVTQGTIERSAKVRVIRGGVVVYPPPDRTASLESLRRFKEDARDVREGFECGLKIAGYDDIKVDDVIEAYRIEQIQRTLDNEPSGGSKSRLNHDRRLLVRAAAFARGPDPKGQTAGGAEHQGPAA